MGLLKSAIGMPSATYGGEFLHTDIFEMAAAYLFDLVKNHLLWMATNVLEQYPPSFFSF